LKLVLHAGTHKTGTTSIQKALWYNRAWLRARGLIYPDGEGVYSPQAPLKNHHVFARSFTGIYPGGLTQAGQFLDSVRAQLESPQDVILLSTEDVYRHIQGYDYWQHFAPDYWARREGYLRLLAKALQNFDVKVLLFFRERQSFARSLYAELVRKGWQCSPAEFVEQFHHWFEYEQQIALFKAVFSNVCVSSYESATERGLIRTFFRIIKFPMPPNAEQIWRRSTPQDIDVSNVVLPATVIAAPAFLQPRRANSNRPIATLSKPTRRQSFGRISTASPVSGRAKRAMTHQEQLKQVQWIARTMDEQFRLPGTRLRFGWDAIIGLIPVMGDALTSAASFVIVHHAWRLGTPSFLLLRMLGNIGIDLVIGIVPIAGDAFDVAWKANMKNARLLKQYWQGAN
jgi:Domain of unknown function (DUF4112)